MIEVEITREPDCEDLPFPEYQTDGSSGMDLPAAVGEPQTLEPGQWRLISTGFRVAIPAGYEGQVRARSGLALSHGLILPNAPGTIDSDYRGVLSVILMNLGNAPFFIRRGDRIAQLVVCPVARARFVPVDAASKTVRGDGGFGHTGV